MATSADFFLRGDQQTARNAALDALTEQGWRVTITPNGNASLERGSLGRTLLLGIFAGKGFHVTMVAEFFTAQDGGLVIRLHRDAASGYLKGGIWAISRIDRIFTETTDGLALALEARGILNGVTRS